LLEQLAEGGRLVIPVGSLTAQELVVVTRRVATFERVQRGGVRFVPLIGEEGWGGQESRG
jgi:protein-L-isoaspartate O-methyltransferase